VTLVVVVAAVLWSFSVTEPAADVTRDAAAVRVGAAFATVAATVGAAFVTDVVTAPAVESTDGGVTAGGAAGSEAPAPPACAAGAHASAAANTGSATIPQIRQRAFTFMSMNGIAGAQWNLTCRAGAGGSSPASDR
jgi:hypothetical protein